MFPRGPDGTDRKNVPPAEMFPRRPGVFFSFAEMFAREPDGECFPVGPEKRPNAMFRRGPGARRGNIFMFPRGPDGGTDRQRRCCPPPGVCVVSSFVSPGARWTAKCFPVGHRAGSGRRPPEMFPRRAPAGPPGEHFPGGAGALLSPANVPPGARRSPPPGPRANISTAIGPAVEHFRIGKPAAKNPAVKSRP